MMPDSMLTYADKPLAAPVLDLVAIHARADKEVDEIYRLHTHLAHGIDLLREVATRLQLDLPRDGGVLLYLAETLDLVASNVVDTNDRLCSAIDPLNPTVLDDGSST